MDINCIQLLFNIYVRAEMLLQTAPSGMVGFIKRIFNNSTFFSKIDKNCSFEADFSESIGAFRAFHLETLRTNLP